MIFIQPQKFYGWWNRNHSPSTYLPFCPLSKGLNKTPWLYCDEEVITCPYADKKTEECLSCKDRFICYTTKWEDVNENISNIQI